MKKILTIAFIACSIVACKSKKEDPVPSSNVSQYTIKDETGKVIGGYKLYYNSNNQVIKGASLDSSGKESTESINLISYNKEGAISSISSNYYDVQSTKSFDYTNGLVTREIYQNSNQEFYLDTTSYFYNNDKTLKYYISTNGDSAVFSSYSNAKPQIVNHYINGTLQLTYFYTYDSNGNIIKSEYQRDGEAKYTGYEKSYSNIVFPLFYNLDPSPKSQLERSKYLPLTVKNYFNYNNTTSLDYSSEISNFKYDNNGRLISFEESNNNGGSLSTDTKKVTISFTY